MNLVLWRLALRAEHFGLLRSLRKLGYEGVEIPIARGNGEDFDEIRRVLDGEGLQCTTLTNLRPDANPVAADLRVRQNALDALLDWSGTVKAGKAIGYDGWLMVEAFSTDVVALAQKAKVWRDTFSSRDQVAKDAIAFARRLWA